MMTESDLDKLESWAKAHIVAGYETAASVLKLIDDLKATRKMARLLALRCAGQSESLSRVAEKNTVQQEAEFDSIPVSL